MSAPNYKDTLSLPQTTFPMRGDLVENEPKRLERWESEGLYQKIIGRRRAQGAPTFILHDGPPFANGDVHMGTALNKLLKDLVVKSKTMAGFTVPFIPGWDCHGLPIEFKVVKEAAGLEPAEIRRRSAEFARKFIDIQRGSFRRLGVFGDWDNPYLTMNPGYEADILRVFAKLVESGCVYQSKKPVQWSYGAKTALAEAEVEYADKISPAIFVKFELTTGPLAGKASLPIWTTTPWTLPANLGLAVHPEFTYVHGRFVNEIADREENLIVVRELVEALKEKTGFALVETFGEIKGRELDGLEAQHPFLPRTSKVILANFVTTETGTGVVHTAPGHGADDYVAGQQNGLGVLSPVDDDGKFTDEVGVPALVGKHVFDSNDDVIDMLAESGSIATRIAGAPRRPSSSARWSSSSSPWTPCAARRSTKSTRSSGCLPGVAIASTARWKAVPTGASRASAPGVCRCRCSSMPRARPSCPPSSPPRWPIWSRPRAPTSGSSTRTTKSPRAWVCLPAPRNAAIRWMSGSTPAAHMWPCSTSIPNCTRPAISTSRPPTNTAAGSRARSC